MYRFGNQIRHNLSPKFVAQFIISHTSDKNRFLIVILYNIVHQEVEI